LQEASPGICSIAENARDDAQRACSQLRYRWASLFDAADVLRFGKDLFVQLSSATNAAGISWLRRHFEPRGFRIHEVRFDQPYLPLHVDGPIMAPRPGLLMQCPTAMPLDPKLHELFRKNDWEIVIAGEPTRTKGHNIDWDTRVLVYNVFSLDPKTICVEAAETRYMDQLDELGLEVIPVDFYDVAPFGGGLHCGTVDIYREGECEDYLPKQIEGF
jgi:glycine amidinotransferase